MKRLKDNSDAPAARHGLLPDIFTSSKKKTKLHILFAYQRVDYAGRIHHKTGGKKVCGIDSGASMHMVSKRDLNSAELETIRISKNPTTVMTGNGEVQTRGEATENV